MRGIIALLFLVACGDVESPQLPDASMASDAMPIPDANLPLCSELCGANRLSCNPVDEHDCRCMVPPTGEWQPCYRP